MRPDHEPTDEELLRSDDPEAFGRFYGRHVRTLLAFFGRRTGDPEAAADLTAETFASALASRRRFRPGRTPAVAWLFGIARHRLADYHRRGRADDRIRRSLEIERRPLATEDVRLIRALSDDRATVLLESLAPDQRSAVAGHVIEERGYGELAAELQVPEVTVRQRVSRGLASMRRGVGGSLWPSSCG